MTILELNGERLLEHLDQLAGLRLSIFREYPYLYDGLLEDERRYLSGYAAQGQVLLAVDNDQVAGAITGMPLAEESGAFVEPFRAAGLAPFPARAVRDAAARGAGPPAGRRAHSRTHR